MQCPKCQFDQSEGGASCLRCGVVFAKLNRGPRPARGAAAPEPEAAEPEAAEPAGWSPDEQAFLDRTRNQYFDQARVLVIKQEREGLEMVFDIETRNRYTVRDAVGRHLFDAEEEGRGVWGFLVRGGLGSIRPFRLELRNLDGTLLLQMNRPFRFYFYEMEIQDAQGRVVGKVRKRFTFLRRNYTVENAAGRVLFEIVGPILKPWTFQVLEGGREVAVIQKRWSGFISESMTDADNFRLSFQGDIPRAQKQILLGAVFLIDFVHFEK